MKNVACIKGLRMSGVCVNLLNMYICVYMQGCIHVIAEVKAVYVLIASLLILIESLEFTDETHLSWPASS